MQKITSIIELRESIQLLEIKKANETRLLKEQVKITYESLLPVNLIKNSLSKLMTTPDLKGDMLSAVLSLSAGYLSKRAVVGTTHSPLKQLLGGVLQMAVTSIVSKNSDGIKLVGMKLLNTLFSKKESSYERN